MSATTTPTTQVTQEPVEETQVVSQHGLGDEGVPDTPLQEETPAEESSNTDSEENADANATETPADSRYSDLERQNAELRQVVDEVYSKMQRDPELAKRLGAGGETDSPTHYTHFESSLRKTLKPEAADALLEALGPMVKDYDTARRENAELRSQLSRVSKTVGSTEYTRALSENGISQDVQKSASFQKFAQSMEQDRRVNEIRDPTLRAEFVAYKWTAQRSKLNGWKADKVVVETAKTGKNGSPNRSAATAQKIIELVRDGSHVEKADALRMQYVNAGKPLPKITFVDRKST